MPDRYSAGLLVISLAILFFAYRSLASPGWRDALNVVLLLYVGAVFVMVSRMMTPPDRLLRPDLWESLDELPTRRGRPRHRCVVAVLRDGRTFDNVKFYDYHLMAVGQRMFRLPFKADDIEAVKQRPPK